MQTVFGEVASLLLTVWSAISCSCSCLAKSWIFLAFRRAKYRSAPLSSLDTLIAGPGGMYLPSGPLCGIEAMSVSKGVCSGECAVPVVLEDRDPLTLVLASGSLVAVFGPRRDGFREGIGDV